MPINRLQSLQTRKLIIVLQYVFNSQILAEQLGELKREAFNLRFQAATGQLEKASRVKEVRRSIARIKTQQTERSRSAAK